MLQLNNCPVCGHTGFESFLTCKDYTVSGEYFNIVSCSACTFKFTNPRPSDSEIGKYYKSENYVSHSDTKKGLINQLYHQVRKRTLKNKLSLVSQYVSRGTILDYGCGTGMFLKTCQQAGWDCFGYEPDFDAREMAIEKGLKVLSEKQKLKDSAGTKTFDVITLWHVLEHVTDLQPTLQFFKDNLSGDGRLVIAVPNYTSYDASLYKQYWAGYDVPRHIYHFSKVTMEKLLAQYGFKLEECKPMPYDSYYVSMLSEKYKNGTINYFKAFMNGLRSNSKAKDASMYSSVIYIFRKA